MSVVRSFQDCRRSFCVCVDLLSVNDAQSGEGVADKSEMRMSDSWVVGDQWWWAQCSAVVVYGYAIQMPEQNANVSMNDIVVDREKRRKKEWERKVGSGRSDERVVWKATASFYGRGAKISPREGREGSSDRLCSVCTLKTGW